MKRIRSVIFGLTLLVGLVMPVVVGVQDVSAAKSVCDDSNVDADVKKAAGCPGGSSLGVMDVVVNIVDVVIGFVGVITVGVMIYGGITYTTSQGDASKTKKGQQILIYGAVGLIVALLAYAIVSFVDVNILK